MLLALAAPEQTQDSIKTVTLDGVDVVSYLKEEGSLRQQAGSSSRLSAKVMAERGITEMKSLGTIAPNFFMPDYGSRQTSAIYMRGIGSRIGTPAVGLYVDNVPYYDKSAFDFSFYEIESIDVLRGPQSTLYGRNAMSGLLRLHTCSPFDRTGTHVRLGMSTADWRRQVSLTHYHRVSDKFAFSAGGFYDGSNGFFKNDLTGDKADASESGGGRIRAILKANSRLTFDANLSYEYSDEGTYPYYYTGATSGKEEYAGIIGKISSNLAGRYRRGLLNASINTEYRTENLTLNSVTAYQGNNDRMFMDQDFISDDIYSLEQKQRTNTLSEELLVKNNGNKRWNWLTGVNLFGQWQNTKAPVTFRKDGVDWLNTTINTNANRFMPDVKAGPMTMHFVFSDEIQGNELRFNDNFDTPTFGAALFHQSTFKRLFGVEGLSASVGARLDYEKMTLDYQTWYDFEHTYSLSGKLESPTMSRVIPMVPEATYQVSNSSLNGKVSNDYLTVLPKASLMYAFGAGNVYGTVSRGYRSGGYSVQNISELLRVQMQTDMMGNVAEVTIPVLDKQQAVPADKKEEIKNILMRMATSVPADVEGACMYKPEYAWNYELGTHLNFFDHALTLDLSTYLSDVRNLQLSRMSETGLGRTITNAGRSRSLGVEMSLRAHPATNLAIGASYGFTHATFREYSVYDADKQEVDCRGNHVPYVPSQTFNVDAAYTLPLAGSALRSVTFAADLSGADKIYWDEQNLYSQSLYMLLGARVQLAFKKVDVQLWGRNLTDTKYDTFWFESMSRGYEQHGKPLQLGITASLHL